MRFETDLLTIYNLAPSEASVKSVHGMFKPFELLIVNVDLNALPGANESCCLHMTFDLLTSQLRLVVLCLGFCHLASQLSLFFSVSCFGQSSSCLRTIRHNQRAEKSPSQLSTHESPLLAGILGRTKK